MAAQHPPKRGAGVLSETNDAEDFKSLLAEFQQSVNHEVKQTITSFESRMSNEFVSLVQKAEELNSRKFNHLNVEVADIKSRQKQSEDDMATMRAQVQEMQKVLSIAEKAVITQRDVDADEWSRDPLLHVLRIGASEEISRCKLHEVVNTWLTGCNLAEDDWSISGPDLGKQFQLVFKGDGVIGPRRAKRCNFSLRDENGKWRQLAVPTKGGAATLFIGPDQSGQARTYHSIGKKLLAILREAYPDKKFYQARGEDTIQANFVEIIQISSEARNETEILWKHEDAAEQGISKEQIMEAFKSNGKRASSSNTPWRP